MLAHSSHASAHSAQIIAERLSRQTVLKRALASSALEPRDHAKHPAEINQQDELPDFECE